MRHVPSFAKATEREQSAEAPLVVELVENQDALDLLQAIYRDPKQPMRHRMRAAIEALPFERPKLAATAILYQGDFASRLERAIERSGKTPAVIEAKTGENLNTVS